jgi:flagellar biogenesis protein FliO
MTPALFATAHGLGTGTAVDPSIGSSLLKMVFGLVAVIASILVVSKVLNHVRGGGPKTRSVSGLEVLSRQSLGKGLQLAVVRFCGREVLVGIAGQTITFYEEPGLAVANPPASPREEGYLEQGDYAPVDHRALAEQLANAGTPGARPSGGLAALFGQNAAREWSPAGQPSRQGFAALGVGQGASASGRSMLERLRDATARR